MHRQGRIKVRLLGSSELWGPSLATGGGCCARGGQFFRKHLTDVVLPKKESSSDPTGVASCAAQTAIFDALPRPLPGLEPIPVNTAGTYVLGQFLSFFNVLVLGNVYLYFTYGTQ